MPADVNNAFDVAFWFADTALNENEYLQPQKLQRLLFIAQAYYAVMNKGRRLMPAVFVADEAGPVEPNVYMSFSKGRPDIEAELFLPNEVEDFLSGVWSKFGHLTIERLNKITKDTNAYRNALLRGPRAEIPLADMMSGFVQSREAPGREQVRKPNVYRTQSGRPVQIKAWVPRGK
ncbi:MAG: DUF4065 domain-containing protein [Proteobacteria bacterium]|nr:DUF4065 domain-containing protein [Pseudomonadota bacterium]